MSAHSKAPEWYFFKAGSRTSQQAGPFSLEQLGSLAQAGTLEPADLVWDPQLSRWQLASQTPDLFPAVASPVVPVSDAAPSRPAWSAATRSRSWLPWLAPLLALIIVGAGVGVYFGFLRDSGGQTAGDQTTTSQVVTTTIAEVTTTTEAPPAWTELGPAGEVPSARAAGSLVYDPGTSKVILFGGLQADNTVVNDTWAYDPAANAWKELGPAGEAPSARAAGSLVYDPGTSKVILFGGLQGGNTAVNDTWAYDPAANAWKELGPAGEVPSARAAPSMVYDLGTGKVILSGGVQTDGTVVNDTWSYDSAANTWTELLFAGDVPPARAAHSMVYDRGTGKVILFGGLQADSTVLTDTWAFDSAANTWTELPIVGVVPPAGNAMYMVYDPDPGKVVLFGGKQADGTMRNDTWALDPAANTWAELSPAGEVPSARASHSMVYDPGSGKIFLFGGGDGVQVYNDIWAFEL